MRELHRQAILLLVGSANLADWSPFDAPKAIRVLARACEQWGLRVRLRLARLSLMCMKCAARGCWEDNKVLENISGDGVLTGCRSAASVLLLDDRRPWPLDLIEAIAREGYAVMRARQIERVPSMLLTGGIIALLICARPLGMRDRLALKKCRELSPEVAVVVASTEGVKPDLKQALESGATAFLSWPSPPGLLRKALTSGNGSRSAVRLDMPGSIESSVRPQGGPSSDQEN